MSYVFFFCFNLYKSCHKFHTFFVISYSLKNRRGRTAAWFLYFFFKVFIKFPVGGQLECVLYYPCWLTKILFFSSKFLHLIVINVIKCRTLFFFSVLNVTFFFDFDITHSTKLYFSNNSTKWKNKLPIKFLVFSTLTGK